MTTLAITAANIAGRAAVQTATSFALSAANRAKGEILGVDRLWANGAPLETRGVTYRVYRGTDTQSPDPIISAIEGANIPAFRNTAYIVFEDFPLDDFGARLPQINAEVIRLPPSNDPQVSPKMETLIKGMSR